MNTLPMTANGTFDLSAFSGEELNELLEAIEDEMDKRQYELEKATQEFATKVQPVAKAKKEAKKTLDAIPNDAKPHYADGRHTSAKIIWLDNVRTEGVDFSDVDMDKVEKLAKIYIRDNGNTIPMLLESTGYEDSELYYQLQDVGQSKVIYLALQKAYEMNMEVASMAIIRQGQCYMMSHEANGKMDNDLTSEYELLM